MDQVKEYIVLLLRSFVKRKAGNNLVGFGKRIAHMRVHSFVTSRLDYCNCLYAGVPFYLLERLQKFQNKVVRLVLRKGRKHDSKELLRLLHWLPVQKRLDFKIACLVFKSLNNLSQSYIQDLIEIYKPTRTLRSSASISLKTPIPPNAFVGRAFPFNAPKIWNNLSHGTRSCTSLQSFKKCLKTEFLSLTLYSVRKCLSFMPHSFYYIVDHRLLIFKISLCPVYACMN